MLRGIAKAGGGDTPEDRYGFVVALSNLSKTLNEADDGSALTAAAEASAMMLRVERAVVFLAGLDCLEVGGTSGMEDDEKLLAAVQSIANTCLTSSSPVLYPNVANDPSPAAKKMVDFGVMSMIAVPMRVGDTNTGAIVAMSSSLRAFSPADLELLHVVASQAALTAWRTRNAAAPTQETSPKDRDNLINLAQRKIRELSLLNHVSEAMNSTLDLDRLLDISLEELLTAVKADAGSLMLISEESNRLEICASRGVDKKFVQSTSQNVGSSIAGWVAEHGESVLVSDAHADPRFKMSAFRDHITSSASVPLKVKGTVIGVLNVSTFHPDRTFDERDLEFLGTIANQMAVAIENARLYARVQRRTKQLDSLLQIAETVTSTLNLDEVLDRLSKDLCKLFSLDVCVILLQDEISDRMRFGHGAGLKTKRKYIYMDLASPLAARVKDTRKKIVLRDLNTSQKLRSKVSQDEDLHGAICMPLMNSGKLVGIAAAFSHEPRTFVKSQKEIMRPLGELAGVAISNARIYRQKYRLAALMQQKMIPSEIPQIPSLDIGHKFLPAHEVGGDYFDFLNSGQDCMGIVMADVAGNDVEAAEFTVVGKHVLRAYARDCASPADVVARTNDLICEDVRAETFISLFYGVLDLKTHVLRFANAGCEPALLYSASDSQVTRLTADGMLLGIRPGVRCKERAVSLQPGDVLFLYTDGLTEASSEQGRFGYQPAADIIQANANLGAQEIVDAVHDALLEFSGGRTTDDVAMLAIKVLE